MLARPTTRLFSLLFLLSTGCPTEPQPEPLDLKACFTDGVAALASDEMQGRGIGTDGLEKASVWAEERLKTLGLADGGMGFRQPFKVTTGVSLGKENKLQAGDSPLVVSKNFTPMGISSSGSFTGGLVFAGYGIQAKDLKYDDYAGVDVTGKVVLALRYEPGENDENSLFDGKRASRWSDLRYKAYRAREAGAAALIFVTGPMGESEDAPDGLPPLRVSGPTSDAGIPVLQVTREVADQWLASAKLNLADLQQAIEADYQPHSKELDLQVSGQVDLTLNRAEVRNIIGVLPGSGALKDEAVVVGAHIDHLGYGGRGSFRPEEKAIHNGADDNASGVAAMLCSVEDVKRKLASTTGDRRSLVVLAFNAEESGLGGSGYYVENPAIALDKTTAMVNLDMVGRVRDNKLQVLGTDSAPQWEGWLTEPGKKAGLTLNMGGDGYGPSDQMSFYSAGIPVVHFFSGAHEEYHTPEDDIPTLNTEGGAQVTGLVSDVLQTLLTSAERPTYQKSTASPVMAGDSRGYGSYLGTIPDYATMMAKEGGVLLAGVREGGPAERAGLKAGDRIVAMAGMEVQNLYDMTFALRDHKPRDTIEVVVLRGEERVSVQATLGVRPARKPGGANPHGSPHGGGKAWAPTAGTDASHLIHEKEVHFADLRQLSVDGENAEAYFSPDGRSLIFQRTLPEEGSCDQQYLYDLTTGDVTLLSSGKGRTTCGYYAYPMGDRFIYATTEGASEACPPSPDRSQGYVWPLYDSFELVWQDGLKGKPEPFLASPGYDAEATVCMTDGRVVFTSVRNGDLDLYSVNPDGTDLKQLTDIPGYDGGAFFTPDCSEIVWRASRPEGDKLAEYQALLKEGLVRPSKLEIFLMNADGSNVRQLTNNGAANFGPYPLPDASGFIYSSNAGTSEREFDLYVVSRDGGEPEQITHTPSFDGFPMFSPDGEWFVFASNRASKDRVTNMFIARWVK